jgi:hypothetical protein
LGSFRPALTTIYFPKRLLARRTGLGLVPGLGNRYESKTIFEGKSGSDVSVIGGEVMPFTTTATSPRELRQAAIPWDSKA